MNSVNKLTCFKAYDVRGRLGEDFDQDIAYKIGRAIVQSQKAKTVALGFDARATSPDLSLAVAKGICDAGADVTEPSEQPDSRRGLRCAVRRRQPHPLAADRRADGVRLHGGGCLGVGSGGLRRKGEEEDRTKKGGHGMDGWRARFACFLLPF